MSVFDKAKFAIVSEYSNHIPRLCKKVRCENMRKLQYLPMYKLPKCINEYGRRNWQYILPNFMNMLPKETVNKLLGKNSKQIKRILKYYFTIGQFSDMPPVPS